MDYELNTVDKRRLQNLDLLDNLNKLLLDIVNLLDKNMATI